MSHGTAKGVVHSLTSHQNHSRKIIKAFARFAVAIPLLVAHFAEAIEKRSVAPHCRKLTEDADLARLEGIKEASRALGHTTTKTTEAHYLTPKF